MTSSSFHSRYGPLLAAAAVFCTASAIGIHEAAEQGITAAENDYLDHIDAIERWLNLVREEGLRTSLGAADPARSIALRDSALNDDAPFWEARRLFNPHPPLFKYLGLLSRTLLRGWRFPLGERFPTALVYAGACTALFWTLLKRRSWIAAVVGVTALVGTPRFTAYAGFCTPDMHIAATWLWVALAYERFETTRKPVWWVATAVAFAFGICSKLSALPILVPLAFCCVLWRYKLSAGAVLRGGAGLAAIALVGVLALVLLYPFLWPAPLSRLLLLFEETRTWGRLNPFSAYFFGRVQPYTEVKWYFAPVILWMVTPPLTLVLASVGAVLSRSRDRLWQVAVIMTGFWLLLEALPNTPKYDNERQMLSIFPFVALLAALGAAELFERIRAALPPKRRRVMPGLLAAISSIALMGELVGATPFPLSYVSPLFGGLPGAMRKGFEPTYLMDVLSPRVLADVQSLLPDGAGLTVRPFQHTLVPFLQRRGFLRKDLKLDPDKGPYFLLVYRHHVLLEDRPVVAAHGKLMMAVEQDGVPLAELWYMPPEGATP